MDFNTSTQDPEFLLDSGDADEFDLVLAICYEIGVPLLICLSMIGFTINLIIFISMICSKYLMRSTDVYIYLITSLVSSDTITSLFMAVQLLCASYLPVVKEISPPACFLLVVECLRLSLIINTVLHLLLMVSLHTSAIVWPVRGKKFFTKKIILIIISCLWVLPITVMLLTFTSMPAKLLRSPECQDYSPLQTVSFRAAFTSAIFLPVSVIIITYLYFYYILSRRTSLSGVTSGIQKQNIKAARITLLILSSCLICWIPASVTHLLFCPSGCPYSHSDIHPYAVFGIHLTINVLFIMKSIINPAIFALRQRLVKRNLIRFLLCRDERTAMWRDRQLSLTKYSYIANRTQSK